MADIISLAAYRERRAVSFCTWSDNDDVAPDSIPSRIARWSDLNGKALRMINKRLRKAGIGLQLRADGDDEIIYDLIRDAHEDAARGLYNYHIRPLVPADLELLDD